MAADSKFLGHAQHPAPPQGCGFATQPPLSGQQAANLHPHPGLNLVRLCRPNRASYRSLPREPTELQIHTEMRFPLPVRRPGRQVSAVPVHPCSPNALRWGNKADPSPRVGFSVTQKTCGFGSRLSKLGHSLSPCSRHKGCPWNATSRQDLTAERAECPDRGRLLSRHPGTSLRLKLGPLGLKGWHLAARVPQLPWG